MSKREELIREYCRQVNESLHFIQKYMEGIVPAGRCDEKIYWETKESAGNCTLETTLAIMSRQH